MWVAAFLSATINNIPLTAAMIPIILGMETQDINVAPLWWNLAVGVGMGDNGTHLGSTAIVFIVTISEKLAKEQNSSSLAITTGLWFRKETPVMLLTLVICSIIMTLFFDFFATPHRSDNFIKWDFSKITVLLRVEKKRRPGTHQILVLMTMVVLVCSPFIQYTVPNFKNWLLTRLR